MLRSINYSKVMPKKMVSNRKYNAALHIDCFQCENIKYKFPAPKHVSFRK